MNRVRRLKEKNRALFVDKNKTHIVYTWLLIYLHTLDTYSSQSKKQTPRGSDRQSKLKLNKRRDSIYLTVLIKPKPFHYSTIPTFNLLTSQRTGGELLGEPEPNLRSRRSDGHAVPTDATLAHLMIDVDVMIT